MAFHGTFEHTLDAKHRLTVPSKLRGPFAEGVALVRGADACVSVYPSKTYSAIVDEALSGLNPLSSEARRFNRLFRSKADEAELDSAGRIGVSEKARRHAGIGRDVVVIGAGECLELWEPSAWADYERELTASAPDLTSSLGHPA